MDESVLECLDLSDMLFSVPESCSLPFSVELTTKVLHLTENPQTSSPRRERPQRRPEICTAFIVTSMHLQLEINLRQKDTNVLTLL